MTDKTREQQFRELALTWGKLHDEEQTLTKKIDQLSGERSKTRSEKEQLESKMRGYLGRNQRTRIVNNGDGRVVMARHTDSEGSEYVYFSMEGVL